MDFSILGGANLLQTNLCGVDLTNVDLACVEIDGAHLDYSTKMTEKQISRLDNPILNPKANVHFYNTENPIKG